MSNPNRESRVGSQIGPYRLRRLLGKGGMGEVYEAEDTAKDRIVALKLLPEAVSHDPVFRKRLQREAHSAGRLQEPHVVPIHDYGEMDGLLFVDMRMIDGTDLRKMLREQGPLGPARAVAIVRQVASALDAAHADGIMHRDVKPENILITGDDFAYLVDFGIANAVTDEKLTQLGTAVGTYAYMAPERFGSDEVDQRADVYALTCVLHECLTGSQPFPGDSVSVVITSHLTKPPPRPSQMRASVPGALDEVVARGMAKRPEDRYATAGELADAATQALSRPEQDQAATILARSESATVPAMAMAPLAAHAFAATPPPFGAATPPPSGSGPPPFGANPPPPSGPTPPPFGTNPPPPPPGGNYPPPPPPPGGNYPPPPPATQPGYPVQPPPGGPPPGWPPQGQPPGGGGGNRGLLIALLAAAAVFVVVLGGLGVWWLVKPDNTASGPVTSSATSTTTTTSREPEPTRRTRTTTTTPPPDESFNDQLMGSLSIGHDSSNCAPVNPPAGAALATVDCDQTTMPGGPANTRYSLFGDQQTLDENFDGAIEVNDELLECPGSGIESPTTWHYTETPDQVAGQIACGTYEGRADLVWTNNDALILADAQGPDLASIHDWWLQFG
ncbi:serine/threonine protein kinase [Mycobacterium sp. Y57]|uniref:serine/threonine-protein kinase n=1 Tax=Mycolicibacterium xanthum TaxID=2796469 RepID=UPI001C84CDBE|nr:serine/threonine-protein kinase [Mycolicibacterium xanthum]MBX7433545.1 serine/threonine protein kinase [Mycolicibacterium xanthum]